MGALSGTDVIWHGRTWFLVPMMIKQQQLQNSFGTQCPLPFLIIVRMSSMAGGCIFFLVVGLVIAMPFYRRVLINLPLRSQLCYIACDINGSMCFRASFSSTFLFCYSCWHLERKQFFSKYRCTQFCEVDMGIVVLLVTTINEMMTNRG